MNIFPTNPGFVQYNNEQLNPTFDEHIKAIIYCETFANISIVCEDIFRNVRYHWLNWSNPDMTSHNFRLNVISSGYPLCSVFIPNHRTFVSVSSLGHGILGDGCGWGV